MWFTPDALKTEMTEAKIRREAVLVCTMDISKAFDSLWPEGLVYKIKQAGHNMMIQSMTSSILEDRTAEVAVGDHRSSSFGLGRGVPQGSKLGPVLYNIYTGDISVTTDSKSGQIQYADDTLLWVKGRTKGVLQKGLRSMVQELTPQLEEWGIKSNKAKIKFTVVKSASRKGARVAEEIIKEGIEIDGELVKGEKSLKYLGTWIDMSGNDKTNTVVAVSKMRKAWGMLSRLLRN